MATQHRQLTLKRQAIYQPISDRIIDPDFDNDANDDEITGVGLDHLHQGNGPEISVR